MPVRKVLNIGAIANDGTGDTLRDAADKINYNFDVLFDRTSVEAISFNTVIDDQTGIAIFNSSPITVSLPDGQYEGDIKYLVNATGGTVTVNGNFLNSSEITLTARVSVQVIWTGTGWAVLHG